MFIRSALCLMVVGSLASCSSNLHSTKDREMTVGLVQKEIHEGMSQPDVIVALGSPNIVTKDQDGHQTWVYDKIASEVSYRNSSGGIWLLIAGYESNSGKSASTQKTLTVVIKFNDKELVDKVTYHGSKF